MKSFKHYVQESLMRGQTFNFLKLKLLVSIFAKFCDSTMFIVVFADF